MQFRKSVLFTNKYLAWRGILSSPGFLLFYWGEGIIQKKLGHQFISINFYHWSRISTLFLSNPAINKRSWPFLISGWNEHHQFIIIYIFAFNSYCIDPHRLISLSQMFINIYETWPIKIGPQGPIWPSLIGFFAVMPTFYMVN